MGPISGEMSIAPMMTAAELVLSPMLAMKIEQTSTQTLGPPKTMSSWMVSMVPWILASRFRSSVLPRNRRTA